MTQESAKTLTQPDGASVITTSVRLTYREHALLKAMADRSHRSLSGHMRFLIEQACAADDVQLDEAA